jgi:hypothetical protein
VRRAAVVSILAIVGLLLPSSAPGAVDVPGDPTPPEVTPVVTLGTLGLNGWYVTNVTVRWDVIDPESIILETEGCDTRTLTADTAGTTLRCRAKSDGGETTVSKPFKLDKTSPALTPAPSRGADAGGWYNHALSVGFPGSDAMSGIDTCTPTQTYNGPDHATASIVGFCRDRAGNRTDRTFGFSYDATAPQLTPTPSRAPNANGWYRLPVAITFPGADATSGIQACTPQQTYQGPDSASAAVAGFCSDWAGNATSLAFGLRYDETAPTLTAVPSRAPDSNGWYTHALSVAFSGNDATSGVEACSSGSYAGSDDPTAAIPGSCRDRADNVAGGAFSFRYDANGPNLRNVHATLGNRTARVTWAASPDTRRAEVRRAPGRKGDAVTVVYRGSGDGFRDTGLTVGRRYRYRITLFDAAENTTSQATAITAAGALFNPAPGEGVGAPPRLRWTPVGGASYYNLQLIRGRRILSVWPIRASFQLRRTWSYNGRRYRLRPGVYRWYVWPGFGPRAAGKYGRLIGSSRFVVKG